MEAPRCKRRSKKIAGARKFVKDEEMVWTPPRNKSDWPDWEEARSAEKSAEPEGETEVPEIIIVSYTVESAFVDLDTASRQKQKI